jgi:hypothetical protein
MVVPVSLARSIPDSPLGWLPKKVVPGDFGSVESFIWAAGAVRKEYRVGANGSWTGAGQETPAVGPFVERLNQLEVIRWVGLPSKAELGRVEVEIMVEGKGGKRMKMMISKGKGDGGGFLRIEGQEMVGVLDRGAGVWLRLDPGLVEGKPSQR